MEKTLPYVLKNRYGIGYRHQLAMAGGMAAQYGFNRARSYWRSMRPVNKAAVKGAVSGVAGSFLKKNNNSEMAKRKYSVGSTGSPEPPEYRAPRQKTAQKGKRRASIGGKRVIMSNVSAKSAGFFKSGTKKAAKRLNNYANSGVQKTIEYGGQTSDANNVFIGHATCPANEMTNVAARAIIKRFLRQLGKLPPDQDTLITMPAAGLIKYERRLDATLPPVATTLATGPVTVGVLAGLLATQLREIPNSGNEQVPVKLTYSDDGNAYNAQQMSLKGLKLQWYVKSTFKIQNRTADGGGGDNTDVVDNSPIYGKSYEGSGTGTQYVGDITTAEFFADRAYGVIDRVGNEYTLEEPPNGKVFPRVRKMAKAHLDPGQIKTSVLIWTRTGTLQDFVKDMWTGSNLTAANKYFSRYGKFRFFSLEQMIKPFSDSAPVTTAWEHNLDMNCIAHPVKETVTTKLLLKAYKP